MSLIASDNFAGANDGWQLEYLAGWTKHASLNKTMWISGSGAAAQVLCYSADLGCYYRSETPDSADQSVECDIVIGAYGTEAGKSGWVAARINTAANTMYRAGHVDGNWQIEKVVAGSVTVLATVANVVHSVTTHCKLEVVGDQLKLYGGGASTPTLTATDAAITSVGKVGILVTGDALIKLDNFTASTIASAQDGTASGATASLTVVAAAGTAAGTANATATGSPASITLSAASGSASGSSAADGAASGILSTVSLAAPAATADGTANASASGVPATVDLSAATGAATGTTSGSGTIVTPVLKNNTGTVLANETGITVNIYSASTGALVVQKAGQTSSSSGIVTVVDPLIAPATTYAYEVILTGGRRRLPTALAA